MIPEIYWKGPEDLIQRKKEYIHRADHVITISESTKKDILDLYPEIPEDKISIVYHGTNHLPVPRMPEGWDCGKRYILFVGKRRTYKNGMAMVREISGVLKREDLYLVFAGGNVLEDAELETVRQVGVEDRILQMNVIDEELAYLYQNALCFVFPSGYEGFGFPLLEAFDNSCPVLCNRGTSLPEVGGDAALYFDINTPGDLREKLDAFLRDGSIRERLIAAGRERCGQFTWEKAARETLACYQKLLN